MSAELQEDLQLLLDSLKYRNDDVEQQKQALQTIATMCSEHANINEHFCDNGGLDLVVELVRIEGVVDNVRQAALYCISIAIESNVGAQMKLCNENMFDFLRQLLECEATSNGVKATAVYLINCLVHNNGTGQNLCRDSKMLLKLIKMFKMYITPLLGTDGASAGNSVTTGVADGLELWISVCNTLGSACNNPQNEINQTRCSQLFAGAVSLLRPPVQYEMARPAVSLLNYCSSGHYVNKERIRLVGGLRAMLSLLKELQSCSTTDLELAVHLVRLLTTCVTDNGANQKVASQLDVIPVLLELLRNDLLDTNQKLCIVMCLAVLTDGNDPLQQQLVDNNGFSLLVRLMASTKNDELCRAVTYVLHSCLKEKGDNVDPIGDDIERLDVMLDSSNEISRRYSPEQQDDQANNTCFNEHVSAEDRNDQVEQWLHGINTENSEADVLSARRTENGQQATTDFASLVPLLKLLFTNGVPDDIRSHLPDSLQTELDKIVHQYTQSLSASAAACDESNTETITQHKEGTSKQAHAPSSSVSNPTVIKEVKKKEWALQDCNATKEEQDIPLDSRNSELMKNVHDESDKWEMVTDDSLLLNGIDSPLVCKVQSGVGQQDIKNLPRNSKQLNPIRTSAETSEDVIKSPCHVVKPVSSKNIRYATPYLHHGPKKLFHQTMYCLGCKPRPLGIILTSRNYLMCLKSDEHTCAYHKGLINQSDLICTPNNSTRPVCPQVDKAVTDESTQTCTTDLLPISKPCNESQDAKDEPVLSSDMLSPVKPIESITINISNDCAGNHKPHVQVLQDTTNSNALKVFEYHSLVKHDTRPTQPLQAKAIKVSHSRVKFTPNEEQYIIEGVRKLGKRWRHILNAYPFHPSRTQVNIKDKYRQLHAAILNSKWTTETE